MWNKLKENSVKDFKFIIEDDLLIEASKQTKTFLKPTDNSTSTETHNQPNTSCHNIRSPKIPQSTRLQLETESILGKRFQWKYDHPETTRPIEIVFKIESTEKYEPERLTSKYFLLTFSHFNEGSWKINEIKALEWMDAKIKSKEVNISNGDRPKIAKISDYWNKEQTTETVNLLK